MAEATAPAPGGQDTSPFGIKGKLNDRLAGRNWTWTLRIGSILAGVGASRFSCLFHTSATVIRFLRVDIGIIYPIIQHLAVAKASEANRSSLFLPATMKKTGFVIAGTFGILSISVNPLKIIGNIISAIYVMYVLLAQDESGYRHWNNSSILPAV